jgi:hypothetical protein
MGPLSVEKNMDIFQNLLQLRILLANLSALDNLSMYFSILTFGEHMKVVTQFSAEVFPVQTNLLIILKVTQINYVSRNQLYNTANDCQILNFGLSWPG